MPRLTWLGVQAAPLTLAQIWLQAVEGGGRGVDFGVALGAFGLWAGILRGLLQPGEPAIAVTAPGVYNGGELFGWDEIERLWMEDVYGVINYYLQNPRERVWIPSRA